MYDCSSEKKEIYRGEKKDRKNIHKVVNRHSLCQLMTEKNMVITKLIVPTLYNFL